MTLAELLACFRADVQDEATPYLWSDATLVRAANKTLNDLAKPASQGGAHYFYDTTTWASLAITADDPVVPDASLTFNRLLKIHRATLSTTTRPLDVMSMEEFTQGLVYEDYGLNRVVPSTNWEATKGQPMVILTDYLEAGLRLYPIPSQSGTLKLWAYRLPLTPLKVPTSTTSSEDWKQSVGELAGSVRVENDEELIIQGMKAHAYLDQHDADAYDPVQGQRELQRFLTMARETASRLQRQRHPARSMRPNRDYCY